MRGSRGACVFSVDVEDWFHILDLPSTPRLEDWPALQSDVVKNTRRIGKRDMVHNAYAPHMEVDAQTYTVRADGQLLTCEPAHSLPMAQRYFLF